MMNMESRINTYEKSLKNAIAWLETTIAKGSGGSCAYYSFFGGWSKDYPETTGYIIPTLIDYGIHADNKEYLNKAESLGEWLMSIQDTEGFWHGGLHPREKDNPSIFNTGQILFGMAALKEATGEEYWINGAEKGAEWLAKNIDKEEGLWTTGHYLGLNPTYYTRVAWPMLIVADLTGNAFVKKQALKALDVLLSRINENGTFAGWGFKHNKPAYTHTIAYTVRGFMEASILINDWERYGSKLENTLNALFKMAELNNGRLAGAYDMQWKATNYYTCLTGNVQSALCLMRWCEQTYDLQLLNAASKLIDNVERAQIKNNLLNGLKGAIAGSRPAWGRYMILRYPNWAAKFYADSVMLLIKLIKKQKKSWNTVEL